MRIAADESGIFTDVVVLYDQSGELHFDKVETIPSDLGDVRNDFASPAAARDEYGVVIDAAAISADLAATRNLREKRAQTNRLLS